MRLLLLAQGFENGALFGLLVGVGLLLGAGAGAFGFGGSALVGMYRQNYCGCRFSDAEAAAERVVNLVSGWNREIQEMMGGMGINAIDSLRGNRLMLRGVGLNEKELEILGVKYAGE